MATLTVYPDPHPETDTVDGIVLRGGVDEDWATIRAGAGTVATDTGASFYVYITASATTNQWAILRRLIFLFNTGSLGTSATISATVLSLYGADKSDSLDASPDIDIYTSSPASNTALVEADYQQIGSTSQTGSPITYANWSVAGYNDFTFDATGRGNVSKTGISKFGARNASYDASGTPPPWVTGGSCYLWCYAAEQTGTTYDPKLVVTYSTVTADTSAFFQLF